MFRLQPGTHCKIRKYIICANFNILYSHRFIYSNCLQFLIDIYNYVAEILAYQVQYMYYIIIYEIAYQTDEV